MAITGAQLAEAYGFNIVSFDVEKSGWDQRPLASTEGVNLDAAVTSFELSQSTRIKPIVAVHLACEESIDRPQSGQYIEELRLGTMPVTMGLLPLVFLSSESYHRPFLGQVLGKSDRVKFTGSVLLGQGGAEIATDIALGFTDRPTMYPDGTEPIGARIDGGEKRLIYFSPLESVPDTSTEVTHTFNFPDNLIVNRLVFCSFDSAGKLCLPGQGTVSPTSILVNGKEVYPSDGGDNPFDFRNPENPLLGWKVTNQTKVEITVAGRGNGGRYYFGFLTR